MTRRPIPALVTALGVTAFLVAADLVQMLAYLIPARSLPDPLTLLNQFGHNLVIGLGVFLVLWLVAPVVAGSSLVRTIGSGALAAVGAAVVTAIVNFIGALVFARQMSGSLYDLIPFGADPVQVVTSAIVMTLNLLPLTVLAAILLREWSCSKGRVSVEATPVDAV